MRRKEGNPNATLEAIAEKKAKKAAQAAERERAESGKKFLFKYGIYMIMGVVLTGCVYSGFTLMRASIPTVRLDDAAQLKQVFFGGDPWLLQCMNENATINPYFVGAAKKASVDGSVRFGYIDCSGKLPSNKTFFQRFKLPPQNFTAAPIGYLFANGDAPEKIPDKHFSDAKKLSQWAESAGKPDIKELAWGSSFKKHCISRDSCVMLHTKAGKYKAPDWFKQVMLKHRSLRYVSINRKMHKTSFDDMVRPPRKEDVPRLAVMTRKQKEGGEPEFTVTPHRGDWDKKSVEQFLAEIAIKGGTNKDSAVLEGVPWYDTPPKGHKDKVQKESSDKNREHRERRRNSNSGGGSSSGGDGGGKKAQTKDEAKAEEERARLRAAREAEAQLEDDDDVVVSDIEDDEDV